MTHDIIIYLIPIGAQYAAYTQYMYCNHTNNEITRLPITGYILLYGCRVVYELT